MLERFLNHEIYILIIIIVILYITINIQAYFAFKKKQYSELNKKYNSPVINLKQIFKKMRFVKIKKYRTRLLCFSFLGPNDEVLCPKVVYLHKKKN